MHKSLPHESLTLYLSSRSDFGFDYEYLREFEAKNGTARYVVYGTYAEQIHNKTSENRPHCRVPVIKQMAAWEDG